MIDKSVHLMVNIIKIKIINMTTLGRLILHVHFDSATNTVCTYISNYGGRAYIMD